MSGTPASRRVVSVFMADPGARESLRGRWPALVGALEELHAEESAGLLSRQSVSEISERWRAGPWGSPPDERGSEYGS